METVLLPPDPPFVQRRALARSRADGYVRRLAGNAAALVLAEGAALVVAFGLADAARRWATGELAGFVGAGWVAAPLYVVVAAWARLLPGWGLGAVEELRRVVLALAAVFAATTAVVFLTDAAGATSRLTLGLAGALALGLVPLARWRVKTVLLERGRWGVWAVVYGAGVGGARIVRTLQEERGIGYEPVAVFDDDPAAWGEHLDAVPVVGGMDEVAPEAAVAFLALPGGERARQIELLDGPLACYRTVVVVPDLFEAPSLWVAPRDFAGVLGLELTSTLTRGLPRAVKRASDLAVALVLAPAWAPLVAGLAAAVWLGDRARPFYGQERVGEGGRPFRAWKLRTMVPDADAVLRQALDADPARRAEWEATFKLESDPRVTSVGRFLRRTSLDELPQLWNVLAGEMSLVGPRPLPAYHHDELPRRVRALRERVRPGITGLWQVSGRSDAGTAGMERWDPYYVRNWSPWLDAVVLVRTFRVVAKGSGAY